MDIRFEPESDSGVIDKEKSGSGEPCSNTIWTEYKHSPQWEETKNGIKGNNKRRADARDK